MLQKYLTSQKLKSFYDAIQNHENLLIEELWNAPKALIAALALTASQKHLLILTGSSQEEQRLYHDFTYFTDAPVVDFPSWETLPAENIAPSPDIVGERYEILSKLKQAQRPHIIITNLQACLQHVIAPNAFESLSFVVKRGETIIFEELIAKLLKMGYQRCSIASDKGEFAVRGGIIDIFPVSTPDPYRLEFWGDELESIRTFDPIGQKSIDTCLELTLYPGAELELLNQSYTHASLLDYLGDNVLIIFDDLLALEDRYASLVGMGAKNRSFYSIEDFLDLLGSKQKILLTQKPVEELAEIRLKSKQQQSYYSTKTSFISIEFEMFNRLWNVEKWNHPFNTLQGYFFPEEDNPTRDDFILRLNVLQDRVCDLSFLCSNELEKDNWIQQLKNAGTTLPDNTSFEVGYLSSGLVIADNEQIIFPLTEFTHRYKMRRQKLRSTYHASAIETYHLLPGDCVVHLNNGIGKYLGIEKRLNHLGISTEFFTLEYADKAKLYVPVNQAHHISKYVGSDELSPKLHTLGSTKWKKTKEQTEQAILGYAADLLQSYAKRALKQGFACPADSPDYVAFENEFPFTETEDQLAAISCIKEDMTSSKSMDRLVCGDVGYGKTEVAMRAAFKCVLDGRKQVAVLVPTTVLAMQHYDNFVERMANFPVNIGVLSRFQTAKQTRDTLEGVKNGSIDILIGTHRIISDDVIFRDLGLVIIDEEQRFGVKAKEHLKKIKTGVDCVTLSATPIPRTLYMSLVGARDMSVINTPPQDRLPIKTVIVESSDETLRTALLRELSRDGQAFIIHNRVETIDSYAARIKKLLPAARILIAHGQMHTDEIDATFHAFKKGQADILVATTIVENGIDIPNANTILVDRADRFGLATLYQVRGRVGRWNRRAYAYFMVPGLARLPELSRKRLEALAESSGYGGGMKIAMRDLEIRGAGNILGLEQSGHVSSIGFHLYCKLLKRAIHALQGKIPSIMVDTKIDLPIDARIPEDYIDSLEIRMEIYQRFGEATELKEVDDIWSELKDRFGEPPLQAAWLYHLMRLRVFASLRGISLIKQEKLTLSIEKQEGKQLKSRKLIAPRYKTPEEMEAKIILELLKS